MSNIDSELHPELEYLLANVRYLQQNIDSISKRKDCTAMLEVVVNRLEELCEATKPADEE